MLAALAQGDTRQRVHRSGLLRGMASHKTLDVLLARRSGVSHAKRRAVRPGKRWIEPAPLRRAEIGEQIRVDLREQRPLENVRLVTVASSSLLFS